MDKETKGQIENAFSAIAEDIAKDIAKDIERFSHEVLDEEKFTIKEQVAIVRFISALLDKFEEQGDTKQ